MPSWTSITFIICTTLLLKVSLAVKPSNSTLCYDERITDINNLGFSIMNKLLVPQGNVLISPVGIAFNLGILYSAASNETAEQLETVLLKNSSEATIEEVESELNQLLENLKSVERNFSIKNEMLFEDCGFYNIDYISTLKENFVDDVQFVHYDEEFEKLNNSDNDPGNKTEDRPRVQIINSLAYNNSWKVQFIAERTQRDYFYSGKRETTTVLMMTIEAETFKFYEDHEMRYKFIELPHENQDLSMMFALPIQYDTKADLQMDPEKFCKIKSNLVPTKLEMISIPKFHFEEEISFKKELKSMGIENAFDGDTAQFPGLSSDEGFHVADVKQTINIEVDEDGTETASNNDVLFKPVAFRGVKEFLANHPFLFYVEDRNTGTIILAGRIDEPSDIVSFSDDLHF